MDNLFMTLLWANTGMSNSLVAIFLQICQVMSLHNKAGLQNTMVGANPDFASGVGLICLNRRERVYCYSGSFQNRHNITLLLQHL